MLVYFEFSRVAFLKILSYRLRYFTGILTYFVNVSVYYFIWRSVYSASSDVSGYDLGQIVTYVAVGWIIRSFYFNNIDRDMAAEVMEGKIAINLIKPVDTQLMYLSQTIGESCFRFVMFTLPIAALLCFVYPVRPPATFLSGLLFAMSCLLALFIFALLNFLVGTCALQLQSGWRFSTCLADCIGSSPLPGFRSRGGSDCGFGIADCGLTNSKSAIRNP